MGIKIRLVRDNEPVFYYREPIDLVPVKPQDLNNIVVDPRQLEIKRSLQRLRAEIRNQEIEQLRKRYNL